MASELSFHVFAHFLSLNQPFRHLFTFIIITLLFRFFSNPSSELELCHHLSALINLLLHIVFVMQSCELTVFDLKFLILGIIGGLILSSGIFGILSCKLSALEVETRARNSRNTTSEAEVTDLH